MPNIRAQGNSSRCSQEVLSDYGYCKIPAHYFESPGKVTLSLDRRSPRHAKTKEKGVLLLAENNPLTRHQLAGSLRQRGYTVFEYSSVRGVLERIGTELIEQSRLESEVLICDMSQRYTREASMAASILEARLMGNVIVVTRPEQAKLRAKFKQIGARCVVTPLSPRSIEKNLPLAH